MTENPQTPDLTITRPLQHAWVLNKHIYFNNLYLYCVANCVALCVADLTPAPLYSSLVDGTENRNRSFFDPIPGPSLSIPARARARRRGLVGSPAGFADARICSETTRLDLRLAEVANPRPGDRIEIDGEPFLIQGEPIRDRERLVWTVDLRPT